MRKKIAFTIWHLKFSNYGKAHFVLFSGLKRLTMPLPFVARTFPRFAQYNLFENGLNDEINITMQRHSTRIYIFALVTTICVLALYTAFGNQIASITLTDPSYATFESLHDKYGDAVQCPCSNIAVKYSTFIQMKHVYHQVCKITFLMPMGECFTM